MINLKEHGVRNSGPWGPWLPVVEDSRLFAQRTVRPQICLLHTHGRITQSSLTSMTHKHHTIALHHQHPCHAPSNFQNNGCPQKAFEPNIAHSTSQRFPAKRVRAPSPVLPDWGKGLGVVPSPFGQVRFVGCGSGLCSILRRWLCAVAPDCPGVVHRRAWAVGDIWCLACHRRVLRGAPADTGPSRPFTLLPHWPVGFWGGRRGGGGGGDYNRS